MSKVTNFREDIIHDINPYLQNCERETGDSQSIEYLQAGGQLGRAQLRAKWVSVSCPRQSCSMDSVSLRRIGEILDTE